MVKSKLNDINATFIHKLACEKSSNLKLNSQHYYTGIKLHFTRSYIIHCASVKQTIGSNNTIPIFLHQDYNYYQYGKSLNKIH